MNCDPVQVKVRGGYKTSHPHGYPGHLRGKDPVPKKGSGDIVVDPHTTVHIEFDNVEHQNEVADVDIGVRTVRVNLISVTTVPDPTTLAGLPNKDKIVPITMYAGYEVKHSVPKTLPNVLVGTPDPEGNDGVRIVNWEGQDYTVLLKNPAP